MEFINELLKDPRFWEKVSIPITCAFVGWSTNWVAVEMIFRPLTYKGIWKLGWQGIIPHHAEKMSRMITNILTKKLMTPKELYQRIDPHVINEQVKELVDRQAGIIVKEIIEGENPEIWKILPDFAKQGIEKQIGEVIPKQIVEVYKSFGDDLDSVLEFDEVVKDSLCGKNVGVLIELFKRCGGPEFRFLVVSGIYFGFLIGLIQLAFLSILGQWWTMPIMGVIVGYVTNWLALQMIFRPLEVTNFGFFKYQGLFLRRQRDVSIELANIIATKVLNSENILRLIFKGKGGDLLVKLVMDNAFKGVEKLMKDKAPMVPLILGSDKTRKIKEKVADNIISILPEAANKIQTYITDSLKIESTVAERLTQLSTVQFEDILHSVFKEDEMTLILLGALLGGLVGMAQAAIVVEPSQLPAFLRF
ncbi:MAG TPA: DUF445 family protein [Leptospiraceae bacterium]|nr:DUF445 family protein [Leptospiraceae bacterium]HNF28196.1 DUF445 family protein [Leptospiraceae bacterium]HNI26156.1 DUF445 family protein [Leptospiraceae bacterium]HNI97455.1 DUF445 family protein [Leptospiraceae bacterium]HNM03900.1 DUF445 family protein [Leptospiraceae bacterium]